MKYYQLHKYLVVLFFLTVIIPGDKLDFPVGLILLLSIYSIPPLSNLALAILPIIAILYLIISGIDSPDTKKEKIYTISSILIFWGFLLYCIIDSIKYISGETLVTLLLFVSVSLSLLIRLKRELKK
ncbi:MAG: hypothetical protein NTZ19_07205 [Bacteroidetes bacterium]|nr:hypothetical protein [Bacteroidota bacterium]